MMIINSEDMARMVSQVKSAVVDMEVSLTELETEMSQGRMTTDEIKQRQMMIAHKVLTDVSSAVVRCALPAAMDEIVKHITEAGLNREYPSIDAWDKAAKDVCPGAFQDGGFVPPGEPNFAKDN